MRILIGIVTCLLLVTFLQTPVANAAFPHLQRGVGGVEGKIMGNLEAVSGADVVLMQKDKLIDQTKTDENGNYKFYYLSAGDYDIKATKDGYRTHIIITIPVYTDNTTQNDLYLPKFTNASVPRTPIVETYEENYHKYIRHK
jgi:hypothetical protein